MTYAKKQAFSGTYPLLVIVMLMMARATASLAATPQESGGAQAPKMVEPASDSVVPRLIQFSGVVKDAEEKPATGSLELTFSLYQFQQGGSPPWVETQSAQLDSQGRYTVLLGAATSAGLPLEVFTTGAARWLGVQPALPGVGEQPRVLLVGVPYALKAADAETLGGKPLSAFQLVAPQSSAGSVQQSAALTEQANEISCASGTACKAAFVPLFTSNGGSAKVSDSIITQSGTTVGIAGSESVSGNVRATGSVSGTTAAFSSNSANQVLNITQAGSGSGVAATITGTGEGPGVVQRV